MPSRIQELLEASFENAKQYIDADPDFRASAAGVRCTFAVTSSESPQASVIVGIEHQQVAFGIGPAHSGTFGIQARPEDWTAFFSSNVVRPYQSYWGILRVLGHNEGVDILGDQQVFAQYARVWRIVLDRARDAVCGKALQALSREPPDDEFIQNDAVTGKYMWLEMSEYGKVKIFYEYAGEGPQDILFLHTAGSDSRQYHSLMNNESLQHRCTMYAFDFPAHGRSGLGSKQSPGAYALNEESYLEAIGKVIKRLNLRNTIVCGASMAGHICIAAAIRAKELGVRGAIPCEGCDHLAVDQPVYQMKGADASLLDPERVCSMCAPMSPEYYKRAIWWQYSSNGYGIFSGDLKFYFQGWDGRDRVGQIDTNYCPVYMLTGEFDFSCTTEASKATADKIPGAAFEHMPGLGHFPLTENPKVVLPYLHRALNFIQRHN